MADRTLYLRRGALEAEAERDRALSAERDHALSVIDAAGRIQLPPEILKLFPDRRAVITMEDGTARITPP